MRFQAQPTSQLPPGSAAGPPARPAAKGAPASRPIPNLRIDRLEIEGCGPISPASLREGFHAAWMAGGKSATASWTDASSDAFRAPLALDIPAGLSGRELGRRLAEAIISRATAARRRP